MPFYRTRGFTLIEVLVSSFILAVGLLGLASLQGKAARVSQAAYYSEQAALLAYEMADRMLTTVSREKIDQPAPGNVGCYVAMPNCGNVSEQDNGCVSDEAGGAASDCDFIQMAANDLWHWKQYVAADLPSGTGAVIYSSGVEMPTCPANTATASNSYYVVSVNWKIGKMGQSAGDTGQSYLLCVNLPNI